MPKREKKTDAESGASGAAARSSGEGVKAGGWKERKRKVHWREFPGPRGINQPTRLAVSRKAYADLVGHAKEYVAVEVCGVLVGEFCEDDDGEYVSVQAIIRGEAAKEKGAQVTFTQETWNGIHSELEQEYPKKEIVGWYHTHPGFGVEFSEMDLFIQQNFFALPNQVALVTDPLGGEDAVCVNTESGIEHLSSFWIDGHERSCSGRGGECRLPDQEGPGVSKELVASLRAIEDRLSQLTARVEEQRLSLYRFLLTLGMVACIAAVTLVGYTIYDRVIGNRLPPETMRFAEIPVRIDGETYFLGVQMVKWRAPDSVWNNLMMAVKEAIAKEQEAAKREAEKAEKLDAGDEQAAEQGSEQ